MFMASKSSRNSDSLRSGHPFPSEEARGERLRETIARRHNRGESHAPGATEILMTDVIARPTHREHALGTP